MNLETLSLTALALVIYVDLLTLCISTVLRVPIVVSVMLGDR